MHENRNRCYSKAGLAEGTNANTFKIAAPNGAGVDFSINGVMYHKADADNLAFSSGHTALAASQQCVFGVYLDTGGNVTTAQGPIKSVGSDLAVLPWSGPQNGKCLIGGIVVETSSSGAFTAGSTDLGDAQVTDTYVDCDGIPPQAVNLY